MSIDDKIGRMTATEISVDVSAWDSLLETELQSETESSEARDDESDGQVELDEIEYPENHTNISLDTHTMSPRSKDMYLLGGSQSTIMSQQSSQSIVRESKIGDDYQAILDEQYDATNQMDIPEVVSGDGVVWSSSSATHDAEIGLFCRKLTNIQILSLEAGDIVIYWNAFESSVKKFMCVCHAAVGLEFGDRACIAVTDGSQV